MAIQVIVPPNPVALNDLSNVDNDTFFEKAVASGVTGQFPGNVTIPGSLNIDQNVDETGLTLSGWVASGYDPVLPSVLVQGNFDIPNDRLTQPAMIVADVTLEPGTLAISTSVMRILQDGDITYTVRSSGEIVLGDPETGSAGSSISLHRVPGSGLGISDGVTGGDIIRIGWDPVDTVAVISAPTEGINRLSIESRGTITHISDASRYEWEGDFSTISVKFVGYQKASANGVPIDISNSGQTPTLAIPLWVTNNYSAVSSISQFRDNSTGGDTVRFDFGTKGGLVQLLQANTVGWASTGYSLTGSDASSLIDLAGTWNTSGTPTGLKLDILDTSSNSLSKLIDLQTNSTTRFSVRKSGRIDAASAVLTGSVTAQSISVTSTGNAIVLADTSNIQWAVTSPASTVGMRFNNGELGFAGGASYPTGYKFETAASQGLTLVGALASVVGADAYLVVDGPSRDGVDTYANRPGAGTRAAITAAEGQEFNFTDSNTATWGAMIAGGGANRVKGRYNGTNWTVVGV